MVKNDCIAPESPEDLKQIAAQSIQDLNYDTKFTTLVGVMEILDYVKENAPKIDIGKSALDERKKAVLGSVDPVNKTVKDIEAFITFETEHTTGRVSITWVQDMDDGNKWKIFTMCTVLDELKGHTFFRGGQSSLIRGPV
jgi:hypothetical protein